MNRLRLSSGPAFGRLPLSKPSTQVTIGLLFGMVPAGLEPLTGLLGLVGYLGVVRWSIGKAGGGSHDGLCSHRVKGILAIRLGTKYVQMVHVLVHVQVLPYTK